MVASGLLLRDGARSIRGPGVELARRIDHSGDRALAAVGEALPQAPRAGPEWVARYRGEEFVLVLPETPLISAIEATERVRQALAEEVRAPLEDGQALGATASFGLAQWQHGESVERLLERADAQLYAAKRASRYCVMPPIQGLGSGDQRHCNLSGSTPRPSASSDAGKGFRAFPAQANERAAGFCCPFTL